MSIKRYNAEADTTITNAYKENLVYRATGSNMGASDSMEVFSLYAQVTTSSLELSRALVRFPVSDIISDRASGKIPASGSVSFFFKLYNAQHPFSLPKDYYLSVYPLSQSWDEGYGLDMENYSDPGFGVYNGYGTNWIYAKSGSAWEGTGSSFITQSYDIKQHFLKGNEDLEVDVTNLVENWISGTLNNNGFLVKLSGSYEDGSKRNSYYTKKFFSRGTQYFFKKPIIECRWEDVVKDDRGSFYSTSSLLSDSDNTYNLYFYNRFNGKLKNINSNPNLQIKLYSDSNYTNQVSVVSSSVSNPSIGVYKASIRVSTTASALYDKWHLSGNQSVIYFSSSFDVNQYNAQDFYSNEQYVFSITNMKTKYSSGENVIFRIFSRLKDWDPNVYSVSTRNIENSVVKNLFYRIYRIDDGLEIVPYSTGSLEYTKTSYDTNGNYFNFDMNILEPDYSYGLQLARWDGNVLEEYKQVYKFRVE
jgi:hypothetical protein